MSAYIVDNKTIDRIVTYIDAQAHKRHGQDFFPLYKRSTGPSVLGQKLLELNANSLTRRYGAVARAPAYRFSRKPTNKVQTLKSLQCFLYQCTEGDVPDDKLYKDLRKLERKLAHDIVSTLPEYEAAEWA